MSKSRYKGGRRGGTKRAYKRNKK